MLSDAAELVRVIATSCRNSATPGHRDKRTPPQGRKVSHETRTHPLFAHSTARQTSAPKCHASSAQAERRPGGVCSRSGFVAFSSAWLSVRYSLAFNDPKDLGHPSVSTTLSRPRIQQAVFESSYITLFSPTVTLFSAPDQICTTSSSACSDIQILSTPLPAPPSRMSSTDQPNVSDTL